jgi:hypothetical protein
MKAVRITGAMLLYLLLAAPGCEGPEPVTDQQKNSALVASRDSIRNAFTADHLTDADLRAFEENARQKLSEFADYFNISADRSLDTFFRMQASRAVRDLFLPGSVQLSLSMPGKRYPKNLSLDGLLENGLGKAPGPGRILFDSIRLVEPLHLTGALEYRGLLQMSQSSQAISGNDTLTSGPVSAKVEIAAVKTVKVFGSDTLDVWEVFLANIVPGL